MATKQTVPTLSFDVPRVLLLGIHAPYNKVPSAEAYFDEFKSLVDTLEVEYVHEMFIKLRSLDKGYFLTRGKLDDLVEFCKNEKIDEIICSELLTPLQERNIEDITECIVKDREQLILEIFKKSAHSSEGKIQIEMAAVKYMKARIAGKGADFAQQSGYKGGKGPGETEKEVLRRIFAEKIRQAKKHLDVLQKSRDVQRKQRLSSNIPLVCIVGYTNAGKSSLLNILTHSHVLAENKLFATLDTTTRELFIDGKKKALISDTVGFISQLPHHLIEAFRSTLDELRYADLLVHVIDLSNPSWETQIGVVNETLSDLEIKKPIIHVFNKVDRVAPAKLEMLKLELGVYHPYVLTNTLSKEGVAELVELLGSYKFDKK